jgi:hypothetical protein
VTKTARQSAFAGALVLLGVGGAWWWRAEAASPPRPASVATGTEGAAPPSPSVAVAPPLPAPAEAPRATPAAARGPATPLDEASLMAQLRSVGDADPALSIALARDGNRRFPDSADAPERTAHLVHALAAQGQSMEARGQAEEMVNHYPDSEWVRDVERFTGAHRHRNIRVTADGGLETYDPPGGP